MRGVFLQGDVRTQLIRRFLLDIAQHRNGEAARRIDGNRQVDVRHEDSRLGHRVVPGVERRLGMPGADHGAYQPQHVVAALPPCVNVGVVAHSAAGHLIARQRHALCHRAPHAAQRLDAAVRGPGGGDGACARRGGRAVGGGRKVRGGGNVGVLQHVVQSDQSGSAAALDRRQFHA